MNRIRLRELREAKGLFPATIDEYLGVMRGSCSNWENGFREPEEELQEELLEELANYFQVSVNELRNPPAAQDKKPGNRSATLPKPQTQASGKEPTTTPSTRTTTSQRGRKGMPRNTYTEEQKQEILKRAAETSIINAATEYGVSVMSIHHWKAGNKVAATGIEAKKKTRAAGQKAKAKTEQVKGKAREKADEKKLIHEIETGKRKAARTRKAAEKKAEAKEKKPADQREAAKVNLIFQSQAGNPVTPADIAKKVPKEAADVYVKMEENRIYYVLKDGTTGDMEIW